MPTLASDRIATGVWELPGSDEQTLKQWVWTLKYNHAFVILCLFLVSLLFVHKRAWIVLRHWASLKTRHGRFTAVDDKVMNLSQVDAVKKMFRTIFIQVLLWDHEIKSLPETKHTAGEQPETSHWRYSIFRVFVTLMYTILALFQNVKSDTPIATSEVVSGWFGVIALWNTTCFVLAGIVLPWWLANSIETRLVRAHRPLDFENPNLGPDPKHYSRANEYAQTQYEKCWNRVTRTGKGGKDCKDPAPRLSFIDMPIGSCPFPQNICRNDSSPIRIERIGVNMPQVNAYSRIEAQINQRFECAPINTDYFLLNHSSYNRASLVDVSDPTDAGIPGSHAGSAWLGLRTLNGPNKYTNESSGQQIFDKAILDIYFSDLHGKVVALPTRYEQSLLNKYDDAVWRETPGFPNSLLHPAIRIYDATVTIVVYLARKYQAYGIPLNDPVFSAHIKEKASRYHPDFEATAIGCVEQFQTCYRTHGQRVYLPWGKWDDWEKSFELHLKFLKEHGEDNLNQCPLSINWFPEILKLLSVSQHIDWNSQFSSHLIPWEVKNLSSIASPGYSQRTTIWTDEVISWFLKRSWYAKYLIKKTVTDGAGRIYNGVGDKDYAQRLQLQDEAYKKGEQRSWCPEILIQNDEYININFQGFMITLGVVYFILLMSYGGSYRRMLSAFWRNSKFMYNHGAKFSKGAVWKVTRSIRHSFIWIFSGDYRRPAAYMHTTAAGQRFTSNVHPGEEDPVMGFKGVSVEDVEED
ncbi:hypothetical protein H072_1190 [Dactylellina haptotyla CBS 200.50]|uniref:Uncharacterized protein n=1 Tax=Dactylellina haptotyla (strain CBS 200.50) TaxID=1284197 RepID=S8BZB4_DACHA|nr:hypothetical protein H072_1190 [Dactylellina haptotyla CBS 200.50]